MASPLPARNVVSTPDTPHPRDAATFQTNNSHRNVSVAYSKSSVPTAVQTPANDNPRPRDTAIRQAANDNKRAATPYVRSNSIQRREYGPSTVSEEFNQTYNQAGLQPSVGSVTPYRKVQVDSGNKNYSEPARTEKIEAIPFPGQRNIVSNRNPVTGKIEAIPFPKTQRRGLNSKKTLLKDVPGGEGLAGDLINRALVTETSFILVSSGTFFWITFQLPLAIISLSAFAIATALEEAKQYFESTMLGRAASWVGGAVYDSFNSVLNALWGSDLNTFSPTTLFMLTDGVVMLMGWLTLLIIGFVYLLQGIPCVFGEKGAGIKIAALLLAMIGYALPVLNLFPWFILWVLAVWLYPE